MKSTHLLNKKTVLLFTLNVFWMIVIFYFSSQPAQESSQVSGFVRDFVDKVVSLLFGGNVPGIFTENQQLIEHLVRKTGHVTEYMILGILTCASIRRLTPRKVVLIALAICVLYASSDEFHQIYVSGRGPAVTDVLLDSAASAIGICIIRFRLFSRGRHRECNKGKL
jgi:VanZ family protein